jgi:ABC-type transport system substrate-binding protein
LAGDGAVMNSAPCPPGKVRNSADNDIHPFPGRRSDYGCSRQDHHLKIRKGIKFTDGSDLNAQVVAWNYQRGDDTNKLQYNDRLESINVLDDYTMQLKLNAYDRLLLSSFGWTPIFSKAAWDKAGTTDDQRKEWARKNVVGTGPFILKEYVKDDHMTWVKNPNYWQKGKPYLDGIEIKFIPDAVVATAMMEASEATPDGRLHYQSSERPRLPRETLMGSTGTPYTIYINNKDPTPSSRTKTAKP